MPAVGGYSHRSHGRAGVRRVTYGDVFQFLLARIAELTEGASLNANIALVFNNVRLAASVAAGVIQPD